MATYFALVNALGVVVQVIVADQAFVDQHPPKEPGFKYVQTYMEGGPRKNYAGIGFKFDDAKDHFTPPKQFPSWVLDDATAQWKAPKEKPNDGKLYEWDEKLKDWKLAVPKLKI